MSKMILSMQDEFRHALDDGLGVEQSNRFDLTTIDKLNGQLDVAAAFCVAEGTMYAMVSGAEHVHDSHTAADWMLELAKDLSRFFRTFIVPDQTSVAATYWSGKKTGSIIAYRFKLIDKPSIIRF